MASIPGKVESQRQFTQLPAAERRLILKAVNRGQEVPNRKHAHIGVWIARRQVRFWMYAWIIGPLIGIVQFALGQTPEQVLLNAGGATAFLLLLSTFWMRRARRAEARNLALATSRGGGRRAKPAPEPAPRSGGLLGRFRRRRGGEPAGPSGSTTRRSGSSSRAHLPGERPGQPRPKPAAGGAGTSRGSADSDAGGSSSRNQSSPPPPPGQRPYRPRGRKRR